MVGHNTFGDLTECEETVTELTDKEKSLKSEEMTIAHVQKQK